MMRRPRFFRIAFLGISLVLGLILISFAAEIYTGKCVGISDGDTIHVLKNGRAVKIRLEGIDCPERDQAYETRARQFTSSLAFGKIVQVREYYKDAFGRSVARVSVAGHDLSLDLVRAGLAWHFTRYSKDAMLAAAEKEARQAKFGLWAGPDPTPPWEYRWARRKNEKE